MDFICKMFESKESYNNKIWSLNEYFYPYCYPDSQDIINFLWNYVSHPKIWRDKKELLTKFIFGRLNFVLTPDNSQRDVSSGCLSFIWRDMRNSHFNLHANFKSETYTYFSRKRDSIYLWDWINIDVYREGIYK